VFIAGVSIAAGITTTTGRELVAEGIAHADEWDLTRVAAKLSDRPILFVAGTRDKTVPIDTNHRPIFAAAQRAGNQEVTEVILDADHAFSDKRIALIRAVVGWADRAAAHPPAITTSPC
jgi:pimeloyl-ACP methyl ester carboxylesterase